MSASTAEALYELVRQLPTAERLRLVERIAHDLSEAEPSPMGEPPTPSPPASAVAPRPFPWTQLAGAAPGLLGGQDAQALVSASRREADEAREPSRGQGA